MSIYKGTRTSQGCIVTVDDEPLDPRPDLHDYSPTGFEWNYAGSGPAQLSLAILAHHYRDKLTLPSGDNMALRLCQRFKQEAIAKFPLEGFEIDTNYVNFVVRKIHGSYQLSSDHQMQKQEALVDSFMDKMGQIASEILEEK